MHKKIKFWKPFAFVERSSRNLTDIIIQDIATTFKTSLTIFFGLTK